MNRAVSLLATVCVGIGMCVAASPLATEIFDGTFRTLKVQVENNFFAPPVIDLGNDSRIVISFDRMAEDADHLRYRLLHCNADWTRSQLVESEYLPSFNDTQIEDYAFSQNTFIHYTNYRIVIPNEEVRPMVSGNYVVQIYDEDNPDETLLQARFSVCEPVASVRGKADARTDRGANGPYQQLGFAVDVAQAGVRDAFNDVTVTVEQNRNSQSIVTLSHPQRVSGSTLYYEHLPELIFRAGNEYRRFETVRADYPGMNVESVAYEGPGYHAYLKKDTRKADRQYSYDQTQQGRYLVREYNSTDSDLGADYITVHFTLEMPEIIGATVSIDGELSEGAPTGRFDMKYDRERRAYIAAIPLKQGSYNYRYKVTDAQGIGDPYFIDGDHYETRNEYIVNVYLRRPGERYDRLITSGVINNY